MNLGVATDSSALGELPGLNLERIVVLDKPSEARLLGQSTREVLRISSTDLAALVHWSDKAAVSPRARHRCAAWIASRLGTEISLISELSCLLYERFAEHLLETAGESQHSIALLCMEALGWLRDPPEMPLIDRCAAVAAILPSDELPLVWIDAACMHSAELDFGDKLSCFGLPVVLRAAPDVWTSFLTGQDWSRSATRWREALVLAAQCRSASLDAGGESSAQVYLQEKAPAALPLLQTAQEELALANGGAASWEKARSAAERLLAEVLNARPYTKGRFHLNQPLDFPFGTRPLEADLADGIGRIVIEVDGYHHFTNANAYRRDRRKDLALQQHGWLVLRFLADDVIKQIGEVVQQIEQVVARRDATHSTPTDTLCTN